MYIITIFHTFTAQDIARAYDYLGPQWMNSHTRDHYWPAGEWLFTELVGMKPLTSRRCGGSFVSFEATADFRFDSLADATMFKLKWA